MKRLLAIIGLLAAVCLPASAQYQRAFGWCEQGGARAKTNGQDSTTFVQQSFKACTVSVFDGSTTNLSTIFSDAAHTQQLANPFTATSTGFWAFYAATGTYDVQFSGAGITSPFTIAGYSLGGGGGGGGGTVGPGTVNNIAKFTSQTNVGNATCTDDGITPMSCGLGVSLSTNALFAVKPNNGITGTTVNLLVARDSSGNAIVAQPTDTNNVIGVAGYGAGTTGSVSFAYSGQFPCLFDNQTARNDWVTLGSGGQCHDAGATEPSGVENMGRINSVNGGAGTLAGVDWGFPDSTNTSSGGGTGIVNPCATASAVTYYPTASSTVGCDPALTTDGAGNLGATSVSTTGTNAGFFASQQGTVPTLSLPNADYLYADTSVATTFGTALPSVPGTLNQVLAVTSVPDATHIKLGYISNSGISAGTQGNPAVYVTPSSIGSSNQTVDASVFPGTHWTDKVVSAYNSATCTGFLGCTIIVPDGIADDGSATTPVIPAVVSLVFPGNGAFTMCKMTLSSTPNFSAKIYGHAFLKYSGTNCALSQVGTQPLQTLDKFVIDGINILCQSATNSTGIILANNATVDIERASINGCTNAAILVSEAQFGTMNALNLYNNTVGIKMYPSNANGGANSWTISNSTIVGNTVGYLQSAAGLTFPQGSNILNNVNFLSNSVAAIAVFGGGGGNLSTLYIWGGSPEMNASGASSVTIDGNVIKRASLYSNFADVYVRDETIAEASANPVFLLENKSHLVVDNMCCYGNINGRLVSADATSSPEFHGRFQANGYVDHVVTYPDTVGQVTDFSMQGSPTILLDSKVQQDYAGNSQTPAFTDINGSSSQAIVVDPLYGPVNTVTHAASIGSSSTNRVNFGNVMSTTTSVTSDYMVSLLMKSSTTGTYQLFGNASFAIGMAPINLTAGQWTRIVMYGKDNSAGQTVVLVGFPLDNSGPTISYTGLQVVALPSNTPDALGVMGYVLKTGAVNPNNGNCLASGTAANPSVVSCANASQGIVYCDVAASAGTCTINSTRVAASSVIDIIPTTADGTLLSKTCNPSPSVVPAVYLSAKSANTSLTLNMPTGVTNGFCFEYYIH